MGIAEKYNKGQNVFAFKAPDNFAFVSLENLYKENGADFVYNLKGVFVNPKTKFGEAPVATTDYCHVNLPSHMLDTVKEMRQDLELIAAVNGGKVGFKIYSYITPNHPAGPCYAITFVDFE